MNALKSTALLGGLLAATPALLAQSQVYPQDNANLEGSTYYSYIGPTNAVNRTQFILDRNDIAVPNGAQITAVGFRPDKDINAAGGEQILMNILMGHSEKNPSSYTSGTRVESTFALNYSDMPQYVYGSALIPGFFTLPAFSPESPGPHSGRFMIPLTTPFTYDATKNLVIEFEVRGNSNQNQRITYRVDYAFNGSTSRTMGTGCHIRYPNATTPATMSATQAQTGGNWTVYVSNALPSTQGLMLVGGTEIDVPLAPRAAPGCNLFVLPFANVALGTSTSGRTQLTIPVPNEPTLYQVEFLAQYLYFDPFGPTAPQAPFSTSEGIATRCGRLPTMAYVERTGSYTSTTGSVRRQQGPVMLLDWQ